MYAVRKLIHANEISLVLCFCIRLRYSTKVLRHCIQYLHHLLSMATELKVLGPACYAGLPHESDVVSFPSKAHNNPDPSIVAVTDDLY